MTGRYMSEYITEERSCGVVLLSVWNLEEVLLIRHVNGEHWGFPKGHAIEGESAEETARREVFEETGLLAELDEDFSSQTEYWIDASTHKVVKYFLGYVRKQKFTLQEEEIMDAKWVHVDNAMRILTFEEDRKLLQEAMDYLELRKEFEPGMLSRAIGTALEAHEGQKDRAGKPYIFHPLRVMLAMKDEKLQAAAVLHDVVEDSAITLSELSARGFPKEVVKLVGTLTRRELESYDDYISRVLLSPDACRIKLEDLKDNMNLSRISSPDSEDVDRWNRYEKALERIRLHLQRSLE